MHGDITQYQKYDKDLGACELRSLVYDIEFYSKIKHEFDVLDFDLPLLLFHIYT